MFTLVFSAIPNEYLNDPITFTEEHGNKCTVYVSTTFNSYDIDENVLRTTCSHMATELVRAMTIREVTHGNVLVCWPWTLNVASVQWNDSRYRAPLMDNAQFILDTHALEAAVINKYNTWRNNANGENRSN